MHLSSGRTFNSKWKDTPNKRRFTPTVPKPTRVGYSAISWYKRSVKRLLNQASVYSAEATAFYDAGKERLVD
jgi:hypothetical protein